MVRRSNVISAALYFLLTSLHFPVLPSLPSLGSESLGRQVVCSFRVLERVDERARRGGGGVVADKHHIGGSTRGGEIGRAPNRLPLRSTLLAYGKTRPSYVSIHTFVNPNDCVISELNKEW